MPDDELIYLSGRYDQEASDAQELTDEAEQWLAIVADLDDQEAGKPETGVQMP